jgi:hypothetical protein
MRHFLNDIEIAPRNLQEIGVVSDFTDRPDILSLNVDRLILPREARDIIAQHIQTQGLFEGVPYRVEMNPGIILEYYVDLTEESIFRDYEIEVKIKRRYAKDNFFDRADGTSFELMAKKGVIFPLDDIPYVIITPNQAEQALILSITAWSMVQATQQAIKEAGQAVADLVNALTPNTGVGITYDVGDIIGVAIKAVLAVAYAVALLAATIKLAQQLFEIVFPKVRYYKACKVRFLMEKAANFLGYSFQSTLLSGAALNYTILPVPLIKEKKSIFEYLYNDLDFSFTKGYPTAQDTTPTIGQLFREMEKMFNARTKVVNNVVQFERRDYWANVTPNSILPALTIQDKRQDEYTFNTEDVWKRYYITYTPDYTDIHSIDFFDPTDAEYSTEPVSVLNADLVSIKGLNEVRIPFALGTRKEKLTFIENYAKLFIFGPIDALTGLFGGGTNFVGAINNRVGVLKLSSQFYSTPKMLYAVAGKQPANYENFVSARALWAKYHFINQISLNDYKVRKEVRTRITSADFVNLLNNNFADVNGNICEILRIEWIDEKSYALISYKEPFDYANGKVNTLVINE